MAQRRAFTMIELLVVIAIIAILAAILVPAVQKVRAAAARTQCVNNLKQIGIALHAYHNDHSKFPIGQLEGNSLYVSGHFFYGKSWSVHILPYLEQHAVHDKFDDDVTALRAIAYSEKNLRIGSNVVSTYLCPSDPQPVNDALVSNYYDPSYSPGKGPWIETPWARMNYAGIADSRDAWVDYPTPNYMVREDGNGMLYNAHPVRIAHVIDGTSNTLFVAEVTGSPGNDSWQWVIENVIATGWGINCPKTSPGGAYLHLGSESGPSSWHPGGAKSFDGGRGRSLHLSSYLTDHAELPRYSRRARECRWILIANPMMTRAEKAGVRQGTVMLFDRLDDGCRWRREDHAGASFAFRISIAASMFFDRALAIDASKEVPIDRLVLSKKIDDTGRWQLIRAGTK